MSLRPQSSLLFLEGPTVYGVQLSVSGISTSTIGFVLFDVGWSGSTCYGCIPFWGYFLAIVGGTIFLCGVPMLVNGLFLAASSLTKALAEK